MPKTVSRTAGSTGRSPKARAMIVVDEIATIAPAKTASREVHPSSSAITTPKPNIADDEELLEWAARAGCRVVFLGIESEDADALWRLHSQ